MPDVDAVTAIALTIGAYVLGVHRVFDDDAPRTHPLLEPAARLLESRPLHRAPIIAWHGLGLEWKRTHGRTWGTTG